MDALFDKGEIEVETPWSVELETEIHRVLCEMKDQGCLNPSRKFYLESDDGAGEIKSRMAVRFVNATLLSVRSAANKIDKHSSGHARTWPSERDGPRPQDRILSSLSAWAKEQPELSAKYHEVIDSERWRTMVRRMKETLDFHCQMCGRQRPGAMLAGHHNDYENLGNERAWIDVIIVCHGAGMICHDLADYARKHSR